MSICIILIPIAIIHKLLLKHGAELTNPEAYTEAHICKQRHDYTFSTHNLPKQIDYGHDVYEKTSINYRKWIFKWVITRYATSTLIVNTLR